MVQTPAGVSWCSRRAQARLDHISCCAPPPCTSRHTPSCTMHISPYTLHTTLHISTHPVSHNALVCSLLTAKAQSLHMPHFRSKHISPYISFYDALLNINNQTIQPTLSLSKVLTYMLCSHWHTFLMGSQALVGRPSCTYQPGSSHISQLKLSHVLTNQHSVGLYISQVVLTWFSSASCFLSFLKVSISFSSRDRTFVYNLLKYKLSFFHSPKMAIISNSHPFDYHFNLNILLWLMINFTSASR